MTAAPTLPSCPFCRGPAALIALDARRSYVGCAKCGAGSEPAEGEAAAIENWKRLVRAPEARPSAWFTKPADGAIAA
jgi:hypothetical protein